MSDWLSINLGQVADIQTGPFGSMLHQRDYVNIGTPLITVKNLGNNRVTVNKIDYVSDSDVERLSKFILKEGDTVFSRVGYVDRRAFISSKEDGWLFSGSTLRIRVADFSVIDPKFLSYYFGQKSVKETIKNLSVGATRPSLNTKLLEDLEIFIPPLSEQYAIANVLSALDDKIDLLHRQNETLEALAQTLFRQRFIEQAGEDWVGGKVRDIADHIKNNVKPYNSPGELYHHYSIPAFDNDKTAIKEFGRDIKSNKYEIPSNSILISKLNPRFPRVWRIGNDIQPNSICSTEFQIVLPKKLGYYGFIYCFFKSRYVTKRLISLASGTSGSHQRVKPEDIFNLHFQMRNENQIIEFTSTVLTLLDKIENNLKQSETLNNLRDTLLPKLISGEARVGVSKGEIL